MKRFLRGRAFGLSCLYICACAIAGYAAPNSEAPELRTLPALNVVAIDLDYQESDRVDEYGNAFRYRAKVRDAQGASVGRWAWDVFLTRH